MDKAESDPHHIQTAEQLAQFFHQRYEQLAPNFGYQTRPDTAVPWEDLPDNNKQLMIAVCQELLDHLNRPSPNS